MTCQVLVKKEDDWYIATDITSGVTSQGRDIDSALKNLKEAVELFYEGEVIIPALVPTYLTTIEVSIGTK